MTSTHSHSYLLFLAFSLSLAAGLSLGITRFSYGLLLPSMRTDLDWSYTLSGTMNTMNALGYLLGALITPNLIRRWGAIPVLLAGSVLSTGIMAIPGFYFENSAFMLQRTFSGITSAFIFVSGGLLAARLGSLTIEKSGLILGMYYGGTGWGIVASTLVIPYMIQSNTGLPHPWRYAWWALAAVSGLFTLIYTLPILSFSKLGLQGSEQRLGVSEKKFKIAPILPALLGYGCFGIGYIGYMTFVLLLLKEQGVEPIFIQIFYLLLGLSVLAGGKLWSGLLNRAKAGEALSLLNFLLGMAACIPALTENRYLLLASGIVFGSIFLSVVASTTAFVRHNLPRELWTEGIGAFTIVFAAGQILGPTLVGFISDGSGGVGRGLLFSALILWVGALIPRKQNQLMVE